MSQIINFFSRFGGYVGMKRVIVLLLGVVALLVTNVLLETSIDTVPNITYANRLMVFIFLLPVAYIFGLLLEAIGAATVKLVFFILGGHHFHYLSSFLKNISLMAHGSSLVPVTESQSYTNELEIDDAVSEHELLLSRARAFQYTSLFLTTLLGFTVYLGLFLSGKFFLLAFFVLLFVLHTRINYNLFRQELKSLLRPAKK
ncbi:MAG: hypothetical protein WDZ88_00640 [Candidatus Paceibacterota bacterium]